VDIAQRVGAVDARDRRYEGRRAGGEDEVVVAQFVGFALLRLDVDGLGFAVDARGGGVDADVQVEAGAQGFRGLEQQGAAVLDDAAEVVRQAAVGEGDVAGGLEDDDLGGFVAAAEAGSGGHAPGDPADDDGTGGGIGVWGGGGVPVGRSFGGGGGVRVGCGEVGGVCAAHGAVSPSGSGGLSWGLFVAEETGEESAGGLRVFAGAGAPLVCGDGGLDLVDVLAAASPGGLSAVAALHGTAHGVSFR